MTIIKEYVSVDTSNKNRIFTEVRCDVCSAIFTRQKRLLKLHTCSIRCNNVLKGSTVEVQCSNCGVPTFKAKTKLSGSKSGKYFCSRKCKDEAQTYMPEIQPSHYGSGISSYREKAFRAYKPICMLCGYSNTLALEVHHIDKDRHNNDLSNLKILCANCHTLEHK